ncbi:MAG: phage portal protein [Enterocloster sp.]
MKDIREIVVKQSYQMKYQKLERYYVGDHDILHSERTDKTGGDNRIVNNMARYITDTATGYFLDSRWCTAPRTRNICRPFRISSTITMSRITTRSWGMCSIMGTALRCLVWMRTGGFGYLVFPENLILFYETESEFTSPKQAIRMVRGMENGNILLRVEF